MTGRALVAQANVIAPGRDGRGGLPLRDETADLVICSPPYLWKRRYAIEGTGEMGNEANWRLFLDNLWAATDEMVRVLKPGGSIFVDLGDTRVTGREPKWLGIPPKSKLLLPERYRIGCQDRYATRGVIVRQVNIWEHTNGLPESVTDRTRDSHEDVVHLVKPDRAGRYYSAIDEIREPHTWTRDPVTQRLTGANGAKPDEQKWANREGGSRDYYRTVQPQGREYNPLGKLPGSVWAIPSEPLRLPDWLGVQHYAAMPSELPRRIILGWSPPGVCVACGEGRWPVVERERRNLKPIKADHAAFGGHPRRGGEDSPMAFTKAETTATILGYACSCTPSTLHPGTGEPSNRRGYSPDGKPGHEQGVYSNKAGEYQPVGPWREYHLAGWQAPPTRPSVVLDCFGGVGTTAMVAKALGRIGLSFDLSHAYSRAACWRVTSDHAAKAIARTNQERQGSLL